jgi:molybdopterin/thiamine biosynthesis adenylyltransferase
LTNVYKLTDAQIERYSRQIIVPRLGGRGQERIFASRIVIAGDGRDIEAPLAYLVGAGVGTINLRLSSGQGGFAKNLAAAQKLNPDVSVTLADAAQGRVDLALLILGTEAARKLVDDIEDVRGLVIARLDAPGKIAIIPETQGSRVIDESMLTSVGVRSEAADFIAMLATTEAFKLIAGYDENPSRAIIEFDGYETRVRTNP